MPMQPLAGLRDRRTQTSITFGWELPWDSGSPLNLLQLRWVIQDVDDGIVSRDKLQEGGNIDFTPDPETGTLPTEFKVEGLIPGQFVLATARAYNISGGARQWSTLSGPGSGMHEHFWDWDTSSLAIPPDTPTAPCILPESLVSIDFRSRGAFRFAFGRKNGRNLTRVHFQLFDEKGGVEQDWDLDVSQVEGLAGAPNYGELGSSFQNLLPGEQYNIRVCIHSGAGPSDWSPACPLFRMPPDIPEECMPMLSELASPSYIEVKWKPPHCNGAPILKYEVKTALSENAPEADWSCIPAENLENGSKDYGFDGRRVTERDAGSKVYRTDYDGMVLDPNVKYYFKVRACNVVGWGAWSTPTGFLTKPVKPGKLPDLRFVSRSKSHVSVEWAEPQCHGKPVLRYDLFAAPHQAYVKWVQMTVMLLETTPSMNDGVDHTETLGDSVLNEETGKHQFDQLICDHGMYIPLSSDHLQYTLTGLLPGGSYFFMARAVNDIGKGQFSSVTEAFYTLPDELGSVEPLVVQSVTETDAQVSFRLPFNQGTKIEDVSLSLVRTDGPLSKNELDPDTGEILPHLAGQKHILRPEDLQSIAPKPLTTKVAGLSYTLRKNHRDEGLEGPTEHEPNFIVCTGRTYFLMFEKLRPGTSYEATWRCRADSSWSTQAESISFTTNASIPDDPVPMVVFGL